MSNNFNNRVLLFFTPYLGLYLIFWCFDISLNVLLPLFQATHIINILLLLKDLSRAKSFISNPDVLVFLIAFLFCLLPGAYLEYPSDPWEHLRRIFRWQDLGLISEYPPNSKGKFFYFWSYSIVGWIPIEYRRFSLDLYSAIWESLVAFQVYRLAKALGASSRTAWLHPFGFILLFGTNVFNFRYYSLSSTALAYFVFLELMISAVRRSSKDLPPSLPISLVGLILIFFNHTQEIIFSVIGLVAIWGHLIVRRNITVIRKRHLIWIFSIVLLGILIGTVLIEYRPEYFAKMLPGQLSIIGSFRIWDPAFSFYIDTLGVHGILAILFSLFFCTSGNLVFVLGLVPVLTLLYPPTALAYAATFPMGYLTYRILFAFPLSVPLVFALERVLQHSMLRRFYRFIPLIILGIIAILAYPTSSPWRGRMKFQLYNVPSDLALEPIDQTVQWFIDNRNVELLRQCRILTDNVTRTALSAHLGLSEGFYGGEATRRARIVETQTLRTEGAIKDYIQRHQPFCGILIPELSLVPRLTPGIMGPRSGHWDSTWVDQKYLIGGEFKAAVEALGWKVTEVPPYYKYYEPDFDNSYSVP